MIAFFTQYYRGLGHAMRIKYITDCLPTDSFIVINQLFNPPLEYNTRYSYYLEENIVNTNNDYKFLMQSDRVRKRTIDLEKLLNKHPNITTLVCEGFPFCRQQFSYEYFFLFEECKKRKIKLVISIRDFPWDEPHYRNLQDWVAKTTNYIINSFDCNIIIHGDDKFLPLMNDLTVNYYWSELLPDIKDRIYYSGYVCNPSIKKHSRKNNNVYISCGLNKEESFYIYNKILKSLVPKNPDLKFIVALGDKNLHSKIGNRDSEQVSVVNYIPNLSKKLEDCFAYITYGGYNSTTDILKSKVPSIVIPRQDGHKLEQLIRCYKLRPYEVFKVCSYYNLSNISKYLKDIKDDYNNYPKNIDLNLEGAENSARFIENL
jgi:predicted glycosyltransferase